MKTNTFLLFALFMSITLFTYAQGSATAILPFNEGKVLSQDDISFLQLVNGQAGQPNSRGGMSGEVIISGNQLTVGAKLSKEQSVAINQAVEANVKANQKTITKEIKSPEQTSRGAEQSYCGYCCYYYWWDYSCGCYLYQWYYCCDCY
jgi:hypothetical protein